MPSSRRLRWALDLVGLGGRLLLLTFFASLAWGSRSPHGEPTPFTYLAYALCAAGLVLVLVAATLVAVWSLAGAWLVGLALAALSASPIYLDVREKLAWREFERRYDVNTARTEPGPGPLIVTAETPGPEDAARSGRSQPSKLTLRFGKSTVVLYDPFGAGYQPTAERRRSGYDVGPVQTWVNGRDLSVRTPTHIRPLEQGSGRYHTSLTGCLIKDRQESWRRLAILQRIDAEFPAGRFVFKEWRDAARFRLLLIDTDGTVRQEEFGFLERHRPLYRAYLVQSTVIGSTGLYRDEVSWPTYLIFVYPYGTGLLSLAFLLFAGVRLATRARAAPA